MLPLVQNILIDTIDAGLFLNAFIFFKLTESKLKQQLGKIRANVNKFQRDLQDVKPSPEFVEKLKEIMEEIENSMMTFKEQQRQMYYIFFSCNL